MVKEPIAVNANGAVSTRKYTSGEIRGPDSIIAVTTAKTIKPPGNGRNIQHSNSPPPNESFSKGCLAAHRLP
ncbi:MAG: hypothetical protein V1899_05120 [Planctomycetota bacterium]